MRGITVNSSFKSNPTFDFKPNAGMNGLVKTGFKVTASGTPVEGKQKTWKVTSSALNFNELRTSGFKVNAEYDKKGNARRVRVLDVNNVTAAETVFNIIAACNENVVVTYRDTLDSESTKLAKKTKKPLWVVSFEGGDVVLERQF